MEIVMGLRGDIVVPRAVFEGSGLTPGTCFTVVVNDGTLTLVPCTPPRTPAHAPSQVPPRTPAPSQAAPALEALA